MNKQQLFISTMAEDAAETARGFGLGVELAQFCWAENMDTHLKEAEQDVARTLISPRRVLHAPFSELCPAAIDPLVLDVTARRYRQAAQLAARYGAKKMVVHSGFTPLVYYPEWFCPRAAAFWRALAADTGLTLCVENVLEEQFDTLLETVRQANDAHVRVCLDIGHAHCQGGDVLPWVEALAPWLSHVHLHSNHGARDEHLPPFEGDQDVPALLRAIERLAPGVTYTLEVFSARTSVEWLLKEGFLHD